METKIKWNIGDGNIVATYTGSGNAPIDISSDVPNEGIDREQTIQVATADKSTSVDVVVRQTGLRELVSDSNRYILCDKNGARFAVLKIGNGLPDVPIVPDEPSVETYTRLTYIEATGEQHINTGYVVQESDTIEMYYDCTKLEKADKFLFGTYDSTAVWLSIYNYTAYSRFGSATTTTTNYAYRNHYLKMRKEAITFDVTDTALTFEQMPATELYLFARRNTTGTTGANYIGRCMMFKISNADGDAVLDLRPVKRDSDGKIGMLDVVNGTFYASEGDAEFIGGNEVRITEGYEIIDRVSCNKDKRFDTGYYGNNTTSIDVMFQRTLTSSAAYLFGCTQGDRLTGYLSSGSGYWRYGSAYPTFSIATQKIYKGVVTPGKTTIDNTSKTFTVNEFTTSYTIPVAGYKASSNTITKHFVGYIYYFRMWHGDTLLLDWYPCKRLSDGVEGFWDCVTQTFVEPI